MERLEKKFLKKNENDYLCKDDNNLKKDFNTNILPDIGGLLQGFIEIIIEKQLSYFPGIKDLSIVACCLFGMKPSSTSREKDYIMELMLRRQAILPQTKESPHGPIGTEWCLINKEWWDGWRKYVGGQGGPVRSQGGSPSSSPRISQVAKNFIFHCDDNLFLKMNFQNLVFYFF